MERGEDGKSESGCLLSGLGRYVIYSVRVVTFFRGGFFEG